MHPGSSKPLVVVLGSGSLALGLVRHLGSAGVEAALVANEPPESSTATEVEPGLLVRENPLEPSDLLTGLLRSADLVVAASSSDDTNALMALIARRVLGIHNVVALLAEPERLPTFERFGLSTIRPHELVCEAIKGLLEDADSLDDDMSGGHGR